jgi:hypothetical protein
MQISCVWYIYICIFVHVCVFQVDELLRGGGATAQIPMGVGDDRCVDTCVCVEMWIRVCV